MAASALIKPTGIGVQIEVLEGAPPAMVNCDSAQKDSVKGAPPPPPPVLL
jgi:hypothetical protein